MGVSPAVLLVAVCFLSTIQCEHSEHSHKNTIIWQVILSSLGIDWENQTEIAQTAEPTKAHKGHHTSVSTPNTLSIEENSSIPLIGQSGFDDSFQDTVNTGLKVSLAVIIGAPIGGILLLILCCYCCCKCCCSQPDQNIVVMQQGATVHAPPPGPAQVIHHHHAPPPSYTMQQTTGWPPNQPQQQWSGAPPPQQQWGGAPPPQQGQYPPQYTPHAYDNPNYSPPYNPNYSTPPKY